MLPGGDGDKQAMVSPGRARNKPSNHCAGKAGLLPLNLYAHVRFSLSVLHMRPRVQRAPGLPCVPLGIALRKFLLWAIAPDESNEKLLDEAHFIALPAHIWVLSHDQIELIK